MMIGALSESEDNFLGYDFTDPNRSRLCVVNYDGDLVLQTERQRECTLFSTSSLADVVEFTQRFFIDIAKDSEDRVRKRWALQLAYLEQKVMHYNSKHWHFSHLHFCSPLRGTLNVIYYTPNLPTTFNQSLTWKEHKVRLLYTPLTPLRAIHQHVRRTMPWEWTYIYPEDGVRKRIEGAAGNETVLGWVEENPGKPMDLSVSDLRVGAWIKHHQKQAFFEGFIEGRLNRASERRGAEIDFHIA